MTFKKPFSFFVLLLAAVALAGCTSLLPQPPADTDHGAVRISVDLSEVIAADIAFDAVRADLADDGRLLTEQLTVVGDTAEAEIYGLAVGPWQAAVSLLDGDVRLAERQEDVTVIKDETAIIAFTARISGDGVTLEPSDGTPGEPGDEPGDGGDDGEEPGDGGDDSEPPTVTREVRYIQSGSRTETRTEVYVVRSAEPGPTVMLVGGMHGSERSGWMVAGEVATEWDIDRGTLVVLPEANKDAVQRLSRTGRDGRDLNRAFPRNRAIDQPTDWLLAQRIWDVVLEFRPEALLDLHEGWGLREAGDRFSSGTLSVGQTIIVYPAGDAEDFANHVIDVLNTYHNPYYGTAGLTYNFRAIGPPVDGSLARKAGNDLGIPAFIAEPSQGRADRHQTTLAQRQDWHRVIVEEFLRWYGLID